MEDTSKLYEYPVRAVADVSTIAVLNANPPSPPARLGRDTTPSGEAQIMIRRDARSRKSISLSFMLLTAIAITAATACSPSDQELTAPFSSAAQSRTSVSTSSGTFILSSVTPPVSCTDASGAVTTVNGATATLSSTGTFRLVINAQTTSTTGAVTPETYTNNGTFTQSGSTLAFKVTGVGTFAGTLDGGTLTVPNYPYCGATHTLVFTQQS